MAASAESEVVQFCSELIRIDTSNYGNGQGPGERLAAEYVAAKLDEVGIPCEWYESEPGRTTLIARWEPEGTDLSRPALLLHGHLDVVPAAAADWSVPPFAGEVHDSQVWGRGAVDMKDFDAMLLAVVRERALTGRPPRRPIRLAFTADEEAGSFLGASWLVREHPDALEGCTEAVGEVGGFSLTVRDDARLYLIQTAEKGLAWLRLIASGTAGHGSMRNDDNAVTQLAAAVARIGAHEWPIELHPAQREFLAGVEDVLGVRMELDHVEETVARLGKISRMIGAALSNTANPTRLEAGYKVNVIPGHASAWIDGRYLPGRREEFFETISQLIGPKVRYEIEREQPAVETEYAGALVDAMRASLVAHDPDAHPVPFMLSAGTDAKGWAELGIKCFGFVPLRLPADMDFTGMFHGVDERVPIESLEFGVRVLDRFLDLA